MNDLDRIRQARALRDWLEKCRDEMNKENRYPNIEFASDIWAIRSQYKTKMQDVRLASVLKSFSHLDSTYIQCIRCVASEYAIADELKEIQTLFLAWRLLARTGPPSVFDLTRPDLQRLEQEVVDESKAQPHSAATTLARLNTLARFVGRMERVGVIAPLSWSPAQETQKILIDLGAQHGRRFKEEKASILDRQIEALNDAMNALFNEDERLSSFDRAALAAMGVLMCAPSRINEPLCMAIDDIVTIEDYGKTPSQQRESDIARAQILLLQKGSKGAEWAPKPALTFMFGLLTMCIHILKDSGKRSRMLAGWYEKNPGKLYLPESIEGYRGGMITRSSLWQIINLTNERADTKVSSVSSIWDELKENGQIKIISNPKPVCSNGRGTARQTIEAISWIDLEPILLRRVHEAMEGTRRVTNANFYIGRLSNMLMLCDSKTTPYLPSSIKYKTIQRRFKQSISHRESFSKRNVVREPTIFEKLGLTMVVNGKVDYAWIETHDPRRWITTQALLAREGFSDVILNKWANRLSIRHLDHYDLRSVVQKADRAAMPMAEELQDLSAALQSVEGIEAEYGLKTQIVVAADAAVSVTSMEAIASATDDRPVARTSGQLIILYPSRFGVCLHQHHETPCRAYNCGPCSENVVIKGHLPTNEEVRKRDKLLTRSIFSQIEQLITAHNREIADSPEGLEAHLLTLVREGLTVEELSEQLISHFHDIKDRVKNARLRNELEETFVTRGMVNRLDDPDVPSGALMRYHNPTRHASPGHERALEAHGGRAKIDAELDQFHGDHPEFAQTHVGLKDQRDLLAPAEDYGDYDDE
ncbi:hypothetical protein PQR05_35215 [Paraburkholderia sediminicola]|uniref:hypothetical protein n=1 Tax=Paraburkholderia sediminicola TaxID=458836 RepID=UPI0038BD076E